MSSNNLHMDSVVVFLVLRLNERKRAINIKDIKDY